MIWKNSLQALTSSTIFILEYKLHNRLETPAVSLIIVYNTAKLRLGGKPLTLLKTEKPQTGYADTKRNVWITPKTEAEREA